jgi:hypothetical protein
MVSAESTVFIFLSVFFVDKNIDKFKLENLKMETVRFSKTLVSTYESAWRHIPEEHRHLHLRDNLKSHI